MKGLSKSRYTAFCQCPKNLWLNVYKPEEAVIDDSAKARFEEGNKVGDLAMGLFGPYKEAHAEKPDGGLDLAAMVEQTKQWMEQGVDIICEASFTYKRVHRFENVLMLPDLPLGRIREESHYCAVDILRRNGDGWDIYEVKSSTYHDDAHDTAKNLLVYTRDIAYQKWVLTNCNVNVKHCYLVRLDSNYVRGKSLELSKLFHIKNMDDLVANEYVKVADNVHHANKVLAGNEPNEPIALHCHEPYDCAFFQYCTKGMTYPNVFNLYGMNFQRKCELYNQGKIYYKDLVNEKLNEIQQHQVEDSLYNTQLVKADEIRDFLKKLSYPLYFLDFETMQFAIREYEGTRPYQQITFQYSLHWIEKEGGKLDHKGFLGDSVHDPRRALAEQLCNDIPMGVCTTAYNKSFECGRIRELAKAFPDLSAHLLDIEKNIVDLIEPFRQKMAYLPDMNGSFSIKHVLPALYPNDPSLNYASLKGSVHNGGEAMTIYPKIAEMNDADAKAAQASLKEYCRLDTLAMVRVWEKLIYLSNK